jgi:integrase/recombinase XerD
MIDYKQYLRIQGYSEATIKRYNERTEHFIAWCKPKKLSPATVDYIALMKYLKHLKRKGLADTTINNFILSIRTYFRYLIACQERVDNPAESLAVKVPPRKHQYIILSELELEDLYHSYEISKQDAYINATSIRNKVIVGLMVFQGLGNASLKALEMEHLKLNRGKIYIPATTRTKARNLELKSFQMHLFLEYQSTYREVLNQRVKVNQHKLFPTGDKSKFTSITEVIIKKLRLYNAKVKNVPQIRVSVITNWLKHHNVRRVQFLAGHKRIMSTEFYKQEHIEKLQSIVERFHPLG